MLISSINEWKNYIIESIKSIKELLPEDIYFLRKDNEFCLTTKSKILSYANLLPQNDYLIFDKIQGPGYGMIMHALVLMSIYPKMTRPSRSSKPNVVKLWLNLGIQLNSPLLSKSVKYEDKWTNYDSFVNPKDTTNLEVLNRTYSIVPTDDFNSLIDKSNDYAKKMSLIFPEYVEKRLKMGRLQYTEEYV